MNQLQATVLWIHAFATLAMVGLIWFVQVVHYPLMAKVPADAWIAYQTGHVQRTGWVVGPFMLAEIACVAAIFALPVFKTNPGLVIVGAALLAVVWGSTWLLQVPAHNVLVKTHDPDQITKLVNTNWIRTIAWTARGVVALWLLSVATSTPTT